MKILFKSYYLNTGLIYLFGIGILMAILIFLELNLSISSKFQISTTLLGLGSVILIYLNKTEPHYICLEENEFTIDYINKFIFKNESKKYFKSEIKALINDEVIVLSTTSGKQAILRKKAVVAEEWLLLQRYFL